MNRPLISCIVPVFNGARYLAETLDSILAQTYRPLEPIVVDDGSTDDTRHVVAGFGSAVRYILQPRAGAPAARNRGLLAASGEYIAFLDADDLWHHEKLDRQMSRFDAQPDLGGCVTYVRNFLTPEYQGLEALFPHARLGAAVPGYVASTLLARRSVFDRVGLFDASLRHADSADWFTRASEWEVRVEIVSEVLLHRRIHNSNMSVAAAGESLHEHLRMIKTLLDRRRSLAQAAPVRDSAAWRSVPPVLAEPHEATPPAEVDQRAA